MRWGLPSLMIAAAIAGSSCFYDLDGYQATEGSGGAATASVTTSGIVSTGQGSTVTTDVSSSSVGGGLPVGITHCLRDGQAAFDKDSFDGTQSCKPAQFWRPNAPVSIDGTCPDQPMNPGSAIISVATGEGHPLKIAGALGPLEVDGAGDPKPRHELQFKDCYVSIRVPDTKTLGAGVFAYAGLVTATTNATYKGNVDLRLAHVGELVYGILIDKDRTAKPGDSSLASIGTVSDFVRFGETNGTYVVETKAADDQDWTTLVQAPYTKPVGLGDLFFAFGIKTENGNAAGAAEFDDYNLDP